MKTVEVIHYLVIIFLLSILINALLRFLGRLINRGCQALTDLLFHRMPSQGNWQLDSEGRIVRRIRENAEV